MITLPRYAPLALALALTACASAAPPRPLPPPRPAPAAAVAREGAPWTSALHRDHPLVGRIWDVAAQRFVSRAQLEAELARARFVMLGERHDNADHHRLQAALVRALFAAGRHPAVAFEMFDVDEQPRLDAARAANPSDADALATAVDWAHKGWPDWALYRPIAAAALEAQAPIVAANFPTRQARALAFGTPLDPAVSARLGLDRDTLDPAQQSALRAELRESHCGAMPDEALGPMALAQRARDAQMARALLDAASAPPTDGAVLIAGAGHARTDRGVPPWLRAAQPDSAVRAVAFVEVSPDASAPAQYAARYTVATATSPLPFDYAWFTPQASAEDPCARFRRRAAPPPAAP